MHTVFCIGPTSDGVQNDKSTQLRNNKGYRSGYDYNSLGLYRILYQIGLREESVGYLHNMSYAKYCSELSFITEVMPCDNVFP